MPNENKNAFVILGLLSHEPLTGYEIKKRIDGALRLFWNASYGSIYPTLAALEKSGYAEKSESEEKGRDKITYTITKSGREHLKEWLEKPVLKDELRYETLLKLFFGSAAGEETSLMHIENFEEKVKSELPFLERSIEVLKNTEPYSEHKYYLLTVEFGKEVFETYLSFCEKAKKILSDQNGNSKNDDL